MLARSSAARAGGVPAASRRGSPNSAFARAPVVYPVTVIKAVAAPGGAQAASKSLHDPVVELQRLTLEAQCERDLWEAQLSQHELQQQRLKARLDALAHQQAASHASLASLRMLLHTARHVVKEQHLALFAEAVYLCGRRHQQQHEEHQKVFVKASLDAAEQLEDYESTLTRMVGSVVGSLAAAEALRSSSLPAAFLLAGAQASGASVPAPVLAGASNNIVPRSGHVVAAALPLQPGQRVVPL